MTRYGCFRERFWPGVKRQLQSLANRRSIYPSSHEGCAQYLPAKPEPSPPNRYDIHRFISTMRHLPTGSTREQRFSLFCPLCDKTAPSSFRVGTISHFVVGLEHRPSIAAVASFSLVLYVQSSCPSSPSPYSYQDLRKYPELRPN